MPRVIAVDWSGNARAARRTIWFADIRENEAFRLESGRDRTEVVRFLLEEADSDPDLVVGLDFAFSFPAWFLNERGLERPADAWELVAREGEAWLANPQPPFWRKRKPELAQSWFRRTELDVRRADAQPKSVFQLGGHGQVGTSSLRGMPFLLALRERFAIWPFDEPRRPLVLEIYPRLLVPAYGHIVDRALNVHARDALVSAQGMAAWRGEWERLPQDPRYELEGRIWYPSIVGPAR